MLFRSDVAVTAPLGVEVTAAALETRPPYVRQATPPYVLNLKPWETKRVTLTLTVPRAKLWSPDEPHLYRAAIQLGSHDAIDQTFGIRTLKWDADKGFFLNGVRTELKGTCNHQDHAGVGAALPDALQDFRIKKLKEMGCNAYRTSHNPPTPDRKSTRLNSSHSQQSRMPSSA